MDGELLLGFSEWVMNNAGCYADRVLGEFNELSNGRTTLEDVDSALTDAGYKRGNSIEFDQVWEYYENEQTHSAKDHTVTPVDMTHPESGLAQTWMIFLSGKERGRRRRRRRGKKEREKGERRRREEREEEGGFPSQDLCLTSACLRTSCKENLGPNIVSFLPTKQQLVASVSPRGGKSNE